MKKLLAVASIAACFALSPVVSYAAPLSQAAGLAEAMRLWQAGDYARAYALFDGLAKADNPQAQLMVGEMLGFGEGVTENPALAAEWLQRARANGNADAAVSLAQVQQRSVRKADIGRAVSGSGSGSVAATFSCAAPELPSLSRTRADIRATSERITNWRSCYEHFRSDLAAGQAVPADLAPLMTVAELAQAHAAAARAQAAVAADASRQAAAVIHDTEQWYARTANFENALAQAQADAHDPERRNSLSSNLPSRDR